MYFIGYNRGNPGPPIRIIHLVIDGRDLFGEWLLGLRDGVARGAVLARLERVEDGNFGDHRPVGAGVWELRIHHGQGYRVYYGRAGRSVVMLICAGGKDTQWRDIRRAKELWALHGGRRP